jgi:superfamily II DNA/RNA helicase
MYTQRASFNRSGPSRFRQGNRNNTRRPSGNRKVTTMNVSRFINKTVITEEVSAYIPTHNFADFHIVDNLKKIILKKGYEQPTPIQDQAIPRVLEGADLVGIANTGTGKTAAFLIPLLNKVILNKDENVMIIVPTRELAIQIQDELRSFTSTMPIFSVCCVGGAPIMNQIKNLRHKNNFIIGTPGRLKDLINRKLINLKEFGTIVLDEADRMLDMGFVNDMRAVMSGMSAERQTLFFSATLSTDIEKLIKEFLHEPVRISVKTQDTSKNVEQDVIRVGNGETKISLLNELLREEGLTKVLIFGRTKHGVEKLSNILRDNGFKAESIHGNKNHGQRQRALKLFKEDNIQVLVATDVAARGLDIANVSHVINFDLPATDDDYIHRIGRTGRGNKKGKALTFIE